MAIAMPKTAEKTAAGARARAQIIDAGQYEAAS